MFKEPACDSVTSLMIGHCLLLFWLQDVCLLFKSSNHPLNGGLKVLVHDAATQISSGDERSFIANIGNISPCEAWCQGC